MGEIVLLGIPCLIRGFAAWDHDELDTATTEKQQIDRGTVYIIIFPVAEKMSRCLKMNLPDRGKEVCDRKAFLLRERVYGILMFHAPPLH